MHTPVSYKRKPQNFIQIPRKQRSFLMNGSCKKLTEPNTIVLQERGEWLIHECFWMPKVQIFAFLRLRRKKEGNFEFPQGETLDSEGSGVM